MTTLTRSVCAVGALALCATANAQTYNYANDFSISGGNPNGVWTYGYMGTLGGPLTLHAGSDSVGDTLFWRTDFGLGVPAAFKNTGAVSDGFGLAPGEAALHGGGDPGFYGVARFTSPGLSGSVTITGVFGQGGFGNVDVHVLKNGLALFTELGTFNDQAFSLTTSLAANDTIDFLVGRSTIINGDTTPLDATLVVTVPAPAAGAALGLGVLPLARRRRK